MILVNGVPIPPQTVDATGDNAVRIGDASRGAASSWVIQVYVASGTLTALKFKGVLSGSGLAVATYGTDLAYVNRSTGATVAGSTGVTASGVYEVPASGVDVFLDVDVTGASSIEIYAEPVLD